MRITNSMLVNSMLTNIYNNQSRMDKLQQQMATGKKITEASDDPVIASRSLKLRTDVAEIEQYQRNTSDGASWMETSETALINLTDALQRVREITVQASNGILKAEDAQKLGQEVNQLKSQIIHIGNSTYAGRYIFSGFETSKKLIIDDEQDPNYGAFNITVDSKEEKIVYEIGVGDSININVCGGDLFNATGEYSGKSVAIGNTPIAFPVDITAGVNDTLSLSIDGVETVNVTIAPNQYKDMESLSLEIQSQINNTSTTVPNIVVNGVGSKLQFISGTTGSTSEIKINNTALLSTANTVLGVGPYDSVKADGNSVGSKNGITRGNDYIAFPVSISGGVNDVLNLNIDGLETLNLTIPAAIYSDINSLAAAIQGELNNSSSIAEDVQVTALGNKLQFASGTLGPSSIITINTDPLVSTSLIDLGLTTTTEKPGSTASKGKLMEDMNLLLDAFNRGDSKTISTLIGNLDDSLENIIRVRADLGARWNRVELTTNRLSGDNVTFTKLLSENEDADMAQLIMNFTNEENVYKASLSAGAKIIQPSLIDFLR